MSLPVTIGLSTYFSIVTLKGEAGLQSHVVRYGIFVHPRLCFSIVFEKSHPRNAGGKKLFSWNLTDKINAVIVEMLLLMLMLIDLAFSCSKPDSYRKERSNTQGIT